MISFVTNQAPFIRLISNTVIQQGISIFNLLKSITNSAEVRETALEIFDPYRAPARPPRDFLPRGIPEQAWTSSLLVSLFTFTSLLYLLINKKPVTPQIDADSSPEVNPIDNMPDYIQQKISTINELASLNTDLSIYHLYAGIDLGKDEGHLDKQLDIAMSRLNDELIQFFDAHSMPENTLLFNNLLTLFENEPLRMISANAAFIQLVALANKSDDEALRTRALRLYDDYLKNEEIAVYTSAPSFGDAKTMSVNWDNKRANNYILLPTSDLRIAMLISQNTLQRMIDPSKNKPKETAFHLYNKDGVPLEFDGYPLEKFFEKHYSFFDECMSKYYREKVFSRLLTMIIPEKTGLRNLFMNARRQSASNVKLTGAGNGGMLNAIFAPALNFSLAGDFLTLNEEHCEQILDLYDLREESSEFQAKCLLSLATFFIKCAGDKIFGTEKESPQAIRHYGYALMNKAWELNNKVFKSDITYWRNVIMAAGAYPKNSDILAKLMVEHNKQLFPETFAEIMPPAWYQ